MNTEILLAQSNQQAGAECPRPGCWLLGKLFHEFCSSDYKLRATSKCAPVYTYKCIINADKQSEQEDSKGSECGEGMMIIQYMFASLAKVFQGTCGSNFRAAFPKAYFS